MSATSDSNAWVLAALEAHGVTPAPIFPAKTTGIHGVQAFVWNLRYGDRAVSCCTAYANLCNRDVQHFLDLAGIRIDIPSSELDGVEHPRLMRRPDPFDDIDALRELATDTAPLTSEARDNRPLEEL